MERLPTPVFLPGEFHGLYSPWGRKESDTTEWLTHSLTHTLQGVPSVSLFDMLLSVYHLYGATKSTISWCHQWTTKKLQVKCTVWGKSFEMRIPWMGLTAFSSVVEFLLWYWICSALYQRAQPSPTDIEIRLFHFMASFKLVLFLWYFFYKLASTYKTIKAWKEIIWKEKKKSTFSVSFQWDQINKPPEVKLARQWAYSQSCVSSFPCSNFSLKLSESCVHPVISLRGWLNLEPNCCPVCVLCSLNRKKINQLNGRKKVW